jgi:hypothetical protein
MTTIQSLNTGLLSTLTPASSSANIPAPSATSSANPGTGSTIVTIPSRVDESFHIYMPDGTLPGAASIVSWASTSIDPVSNVMASDYMSNTMSGQFKDLGSVLLDRFKTTGSNFSQSVTVATPSGAAGNALGAKGSQGDVKLIVQTADGVKVDIELDSKDGTLGVSVNSSGGLSDADRNALAQLANGFQQAINGLGSSPPSLNMSGLTQYDSSVLSSVNLQFNVTGDASNNVSANIELNSSTRSVKVMDSAGTINLNVDIAHSYVLGSSAQQNQAISSYLAQFDSADAKGHGDSALMSAFKDAFTQLNSNLGTSTQQLPDTSNAPWLAQTAQSVLTGLPDFTGSITDTEAFSNKLLPDQADTFAYQVSQSTQIAGDLSDGSTTQTRQSNMKASYHTALDDGPVQQPLTLSLATQNYKYASVNDASTSTVSLVTKDGKVQNANLKQTNDQSTEISTYVKGVMESDVTTPHNTSDSKDILAMLKPYLADGQAKQDSDGWHQMLSSIHSMIVSGASSS